MGPAAPASLRRAAVGRRCFGAHAGARAFTKDKKSVLSRPFPVYNGKAQRRGTRERERKGDVEVGGSRGSEVLQMAANALSFLVGIVLPLGGAIWLLMH
jgi:hypothetical protein